MLAERLTAAVATHGEGPVWSPSWGGLCWVDMLAGDVLRLDHRGAVDRWSVGTIAAAIRPRQRGGLIIATAQEFLLANGFGQELVQAAQAFIDADVRFNEGSCDPAGDFLCGTMALDSQPGRGRLYRLRADLGVDVVLGGVTISNGLAWDAAGERAYYVDSPTGRIDVFDWDVERGLHRRRPFVDIAPEAGTPDGLTTDAEGGVWVALWNGAAVRRYSAAGELSAVVELPVPKVTACTFGGDDLRQLYITTSSLDEANPGSAAGSVFHLEVGVAGLSAVAFAG